MLFAFYTFIALIIFIAIARTSGSAQDKQGNQFKNIYPKNSDNLKKDESSRISFIVGTFNVQGGKSLSGERDITRAGEVIKEADIIGLQEIYAPGYINKLGIGNSQTAKLAMSGGFTWLFCATRTRWFREFRGNALLSKLRVNSWRIEMLPNKVGKNFRNMTIAEMSWQGQPFHFINTHLHTKDGKVEQFDAVIKEFIQHPRAILVGDFNSKPNEPHIMAALKKYAIDDAIDLAGMCEEGDSRIDWILCKGFHVHSGEMVEKGVSDHPFYQVRLSII